MKTTFTTLLFAGLAALVGAGTIGKRVFSDIYSVSPDNIVYIANAETYCMIMPRNAHTDIGVSETPVSFVQAKGSSGKPYVQLTGCIDPSKIDRLNANDGGGQYDSNGGDGGEGNPINSECIGYNSYVELVEPVTRRACIRCCTDNADCVLTRDTQGCENVIPGEYFC
ncbi:hypothetical protein FRC01_006032 [Tulasnella sp. 417]|nr:hypothetical protein FRC01_006032 [Tulasnella sp. 417]